MAATFVVEDGTGLATANAYVSVAQVDQYAEDFEATPATWTGLTEAVRQRHIRIATRFLDASYLLAWKGWRTNETQALDWPRSGVADSSGYALDDDALPAGLFNACCKLAIESVSTDLFPDLDNGGAIKRISEKLGPLETSTEYQGSGTQSKVFRLAANLLNDLLQPAGRLERA